MNNIVDDISVLTSIPKLTLEKLILKSEYCICQSIEESKLNDEDTTAINIGIGTLYIKVFDEDVRYKFIPSKSLEKFIVDTVNDGKNPLTIEIEKSLATKIASLYKELF